MSATGVAQERRARRRAKAGEADASRRRHYCDAVQGA